MSLQNKIKPFGMRPVYLIRSLERLIKWYTTVLNRQSIKMCLGSRL